MSPAVYHSVVLQITLLFMRIYSMDFKHACAIECTEKVKTVHGFTLCLFIPANRDDLVAELVEHWPKKPGGHR